MKSKPITILGITIIIIAGVIFFLIKPVVVSLWSAWEDLGKAKEDLKTVEEKKQILEELKNNREITTVGQIALKYIPEESEAGQLVIELTAIAGANNLKVEETSMEKSKESTSQSEDTSKTSPTPQTSPTKEAVSIKEVEFSMKLSGTFTDFMNFLRSIDSSSRLISLRNLALQMSQTEEQSTFAAQIAGVAFYKSEVSIADTLDNVKVSDETVRKFLNLKTYGLPINLPAESGFGRTNPFEGY